MSDQFEFAFDRTDGPDGAAKWREDREQTIRDWCQKLGLPIKHRVEVVLKQGPLLRGLLRVAGEELWIEGDRHSIRLEVDGVEIRLGDIESLSRTD